MKIRLSVSLHIGRDNPVPREDPHPQGDTYTATERADHQGVGFTVDMPNHEQ